MKSKVFKMLWPWKLQKWVMNLVGPCLCKLASIALWVASPELVKRCSPFTEVGRPLMCTPFWTRSCHIRDMTKSYCKPSFCKYLTFQRKHITYVVWDLAWVFPVRLFSFMCKVLYYHLLTFREISQGKKYSSNIFISIIGIVKADLNIFVIIYKKGLRGRFFKSA